LYQTSSQVILLNPDPISFVVSHLHIWLFTCFCAYYEIQLSPSIKLLGRSLVRFYRSVDICASWCNSSWSYVQLGSLVAV